MLRFPYMVFARTEPFRARFDLTQSGMSAPPASALGPPPELDLAFAGTEALPELRRRIAAREGVASERVIVTMGASAAMHLVAAHFFAPGVRVVSEVPSYEPLRALPGWRGADGRLVERRREADWQLDPEEVAAALAAPAAAGPGHVFATNSNNPTGVRMDADRVRALAAAAEHAGGVLLSCEVYMEYTSDADRVQAHKLAPNAISIGSLTKAYGLGALRVGWIVLGEGLVDRRAALEDETFLTYVDLPTPILRLAACAFDRLDALRTRYAEIERESKPHFVRWLEETDGVEARIPDLGLTAFVRVEGLDDTRGLQPHLLRKHGVGVVPGEYFGCPGYLRVAFGQPPDVLNEALGHLTEGLRSYDPV